MAQLCQTGKIQSLDRGLWSTSCPRPKAGRPFLNRKAAPLPPPPGLNPIEYFNSNNNKKFVKLGKALVPRHANLR